MAAASPGRGRPSSADGDSDVPVLLVRARELLADGRWHDFEHVVAQLSPLVPPGQAYRAVEHSRAYLAARRIEQRRTDPIRSGLGGPLIDPGRVRYREPSAIVASGARHIVRKLLYRREFELGVTPRTGRKRVRVRPGRRP